DAPGKSDSVEPSTEAGVRRRDFLSYAVSAAGGGRLWAQVPAGIKEASGRGSDLALVNARILTLEANQPEAEAALVRRGRVVLVGSSADVKAQAQGARVFDAGGRTVTPGFLDAHAHFEMACNAEAYQAKCHTPPLRSLQQMFDVLRARAAKTRKGR